APRGAQCCEWTWLSLSPCGHRCPCGLLMVGFSWWGNSDFGLRHRQAMRLIQNQIHRIAGAVQDLNAGPHGGNFFVLRIALDVLERAAEVSIGSHAEALEQNGATQLRHDFLMELASRQ